MTALRRALTDYLRVRRAAGFKLKQAGEMLPDLVEYLDKRRASFLTTVAAIAWGDAAAGRSSRLVEAASGRSSRIREVSADHR